MKSTLSVILALLVTLSPACGAQEKTAAQSRQEVLHLAIRPTLNTMAGIYALTHVHGDPVNDRVLLDYARTDIQTQVTLFSELLAKLDRAKLTPEESALAGKALEIRQTQARLLASMKAPDGAGHLVGFFMDHHSVDRSKLTQEQTEELKMKILTNRLGGYTQEVIREREAFNQYLTLEKTLWETLTEFCAAKGDKDAGQTELRTVVESIVAAQKANCEGALKRLTPEELAASLVGHTFGGEDLLKGEFRAIRIISQTIKGHCILTEAEIDIVGAFSKQPKTLKGKCAHSVGVDKAAHLMTSR